MKFICFMVLFLGLQPVSSKEHTDETNSQGANFKLIQYSIENGGGRATGNTYIITSSMGQFDAHLATGGSFKFQGGFLHNSTNDIIFKNGFE